MPPDVVAVMTPTEGTSEVPPHWAITFRVDDVDATAEHALALGGTLVVPPVDTPGFRSAASADPQQGVVAISTPTTVWLHPASYSGPRRAAPSSSGSSASAAPVS